MADINELMKAGSKALTASQRKTFETVHCLLLPINNEIILLPNAAVAEIIPYATPENVHGAPDWFLGQLVWRERRLPLISFESASDGVAGKVHANCRIAVLNTLNGNRQLPYIAILTQGLPSLQIVRPNNIQFADKPSAQRQSIQAYVNLGGTAAIIPDIDDLETRLLNIQEA
jgi:chemosensory pili system protein ChpC